MEFLKLKNQELSSVLITSSSKTVEVLLNHLQEKYDLPENSRELARVKLSRYFMPAFTKKWAKSVGDQKARNEKFLLQNKTWLNSEFSLSETSSSTLRRTKSFDECSDKTKKRRIEAVKQSVSGGEIDLFDNLRTLDNKTAIDIVRKGLSNDATDIDTVDLQNENPISFTDDEALALFVDLKLTKIKYQLLRNRLKDKNVDILPPYSRIVDAKNDCYPRSSAIKVTEAGATIQLQDLLDHTAARLLKREDVEPPECKRHLKMTLKFGGDGTSGLNPYKQRFEDSENSDESLFLMSLVPLRLQCLDDPSIPMIWENPRPCSPKNCLPIMFEYAKESKEKILLEFGNIYKQIKRLKQSKIEIDETTYYVEHELIGTMIDGKVCQHITGSSSAANCIICGSKPSEMNNIRKVLERAENEAAFKLGLQVLHQWIRQMEYVLNVSYRLPIEVWACKTKEQKEVRNSRKEYIKKEIRERLGLIVDTPKQGAGSSNDGNTARKFFENYNIISEITGFDEEILKNMYIVLQVLASGRAIDTKKFHEHALKTANLLVQKYNWYFMPASLHKLLIHGAKIIDSFVIPIGQLSEEAQEAKNKDFKRCRENNTRKTSRIDTNTDLLHYLLFSSDLYLSSLRSEFVKPERPLHPEAEVLLLKQT